MSWSLFKIDRKMILCKWCGLFLIEARLWLWTVASCQLLSQHIEMVDEPVPTWKKNDTYFKNVKLWVSWGCDSGNLLLFKDIQNIAMHAVSELLAIPNWQKNDNLQNIYYEACCLDPCNWILDSGLWSTWLAWILESVDMWNIPATNYSLQHEAVQMKWKLVRPQQRQSMKLVLTKASL